MKNVQKMSIEEIEREARSIGLTYGQYVGYRDTGYLEWYKKMYYSSKPEVANKYESYIGAGKSVPKNSIAHNWSH